MSKYRTHSVQKNIHTCTLSIMKEGMSAFYVLDLVFQRHIAHCLYKGQLPVINHTQEYLGEDSDTQPLNMLVVKRSVTEKKGKASSDDEYVCFCSLL